MSKKLIEWDHIAHVYNELWTLKALTSNTKAYNCVSRLLEYIEDNIVQEEKEHHNEMKRDVYRKIKTAKTTEEQQQWYKVYQELKHQGQMNEKIK
ncbi:MAG: hypothetical protein DDT42_01755 [candidate division WS2 bacterium]|uniref:Uncharacterized protein n=1 Tax=Psychracetigena formicireducens TaxID=2986056 RepID=A0A9E2BHY4_PSYF1|nr:hypothetical protein [Candidatus Psychracetigena formicireducens]